MPKTRVCIRSLTACCERCAATSGCAALALDGGRDAITHILQSCIGRPEITAVDLLGNKIVTDITFYVSTLPQKLT